MVSLQKRIQIWNINVRFDGAINLQPKTAQNSQKKSKMTTIRDNQ